MGLKKFIKDVTGATAREEAEHLTQLKKLEEDAQSAADEKARLAAERKAKREEKARELEIKGESLAQYAQDVEAKEDSLKKLVASLKEHVKELSEKKYPFAKTLQTPEFVLLFVPIEAIFSLVIDKEPSLFEEAWKKSIIIVSPANMLAILRTIESIWKVEKQNRNTLKIAEEAGLLYDKFVDLLKDMDSLGKHLKGASDSYEKTLQKISSGRGNLIKKTEDIKRLGLKTKKQIPQEYLEEEPLCVTSEEVN